MCCACHENCNSSSENDAEALRLPHKNDFRQIMKHVGMSHSAMPATRNEATQRLKPRLQKGPFFFAELAIGTAIGPTHERLRTVANGCQTSGEHSLNPQTPGVKREPLLGIRGKKQKICTLFAWRAACRS